MAAGSNFVVCLVDTNKHIASTSQFLLESQPTKIVMAREQNTSVTEFNEFEKKEMFAHFMSERREVQPETAIFNEGGKFNQNVMSHQGFKPKEILQEYASPISEDFGTIQTAHDVQQLQAI